MRRLLEFHRSPNSVKVRVALNYKEMEYVAEEMSSADRAPMIEAAGWPLVPVLLDGEVVMRDSAAILHYLEANYRDRPSLTPATRDEIRDAERIVSVLMPPIAEAQWSVLEQIRAPESERDPAVAGAARRALVDELERLEARIAERDWLVGETMSMYDVILGGSLQPIRPPAAFVEQSPIWRFFDAHFRLDEERARVANWIERVSAWDRPEGERPER